MKKNLKQKSCGFVLAVGYASLASAFAQGLPESFDVMDSVQFLILWSDLQKMLQPMNDKMLELQTIPMFRELQPPGNPE